MDGKEDGIRVEKWHRDCERESMRKDKKIKTIVCITWRRFSYAFRVHDTGLKADENGNVYAPNGALVGRLLP